MTSRSVRTTMLGLVSSMVAVLLAGCAFPGERVCPAVGWINSVEIVLEGPESGIERVAWVELCDESECSTPTGVVSTPTGVASTPKPSANPSLYTASPIGPARWAVSVGFATPSPVTVRAYSEDAAVVGELSVPLTWKRVGGTEECGGPGEAGPVRLPLGG